jgi:hypothetical protein
VLHIRGNFQPLTFVLADVSKVLSVDDVEGIGQFFDGFCVSQQQNGALNGSL